MSEKEYMECSVVAYPREIRFLHINGHIDSYYVDRHISDYVNRLQQENQELKKQLEEVKSRNRPVIGPYHADGYITQEMEYQARKRLEKNQKEFIKWLESKIEACELTCDLIFNRNRNKKAKIYKIVLSKYKKIIGVKDEI